MADSQTTNEHIDLRDDGELQSAIFCLFCGHVNPSSAFVCRACHSVLDQVKINQVQAPSSDSTAQKRETKQYAPPERSSFWSIIIVIVVLTAFISGATVLYSSNISKDEAITTLPLYNLGNSPTLSALRGGNSSNAVRVGPQPNSFDWDSSLRFYLPGGWTQNMGHSGMILNTAAVPVVTQLIVSEPTPNNADMDCLKQLPTKERRIVMNSSDEDTHIAVMGIETHIICRLTTPPQYKQDSDPVWLPDGRVAFQSTRDNLLDSAIYVISADGVTLQRVQINPSMKFQMPRWSPDGKLIAFVSDYADDHHMNLFVMNENGTNLRQMTDGTIVRSIVWSPDDNRIAYSTGGGFDTYSAAYGECRAYIVSADGAKSTSLPIFGECSDFLTWSPDGKSIAFIAGLHGHSRLYITDDNGGQANVILEDHSPTIERIAWDTLNWSPDGKSIIFRGSTQEGKWLSYIIQRDGRGLRVFYQGAEPIYHLKVATSLTLLQ